VKVAASVKARALATAKATLPMRRKDMGIERFIKSPDHAFSQAAQLKRVGKGHLEGVCLMLSINWIHLVRGGKDPVDAKRALEDAVAFQQIVKQQEIHENGGGPAGFNNGAQDPITIMNLFNAAQPAKKKTAQLQQCGTYTNGDGSTMRRDLLDKALNLTPRLLLVGFNCQDGKMGVAGGHAIALYVGLAKHGVFDPNYGWMQFSEPNSCSVDMSIVLNELAAEYGITDATSYQDVTAMLPA
jgi:hypothetical protein